MSAPDRRPATAPGAARVFVAAVLIAAAALLAACVSVPQPGDKPEVHAQSEPADLERRARVRLELAAAYFARGQNATALDEVKLALVARPELGAAWNLRGLIYASLGESKLAEESFQRALQINANDADAMHNYGWVLCRERRPAEADLQFNRALAQPRYTDSTRTLLAQGVCQAREGRWVEADRALARAYEFEPANPAIGLNLSEVLYRRGEYERARFYIRRVNAQQDVSNAQTLWLAARIEHRLGDSVSARALGTQLTERFPRSPEALQFEQGRFDD